MDVSKDARSFRDTEWAIKGTKSTKKGKTAVYEIESLLSYAQYGTEEHKKRKYKKDEWGNPLNAVVVTCWENKEYEKGKEPIFMTSLPADKPVEIINKYGLRFLIENIGFRELKRREDMATIHKVIVFAGDYFAILDVEEYALITRAPPKSFMRIDPEEAKRRLGLQD